MKVNLTQLLSAVGRTEERLVPVEMAHFALDGAEYPFAGKSDLSLYLENLGGNKVLVKAAGEYILTIPCSRCLDEVSYPFSVDFEREIHVDSVEQKPAEEEEYQFITGYELDTDRLVYEEILMHFPYSVLCKEDCKGICSVCGVNQNHGTCSCDHVVGDPRMAVIQDIWKEFKEV